MSSRHTAECKAAIFMVDKGVHFSGNLHVKALKKDAYKI